jgi:bacterial leucyl aminopeptidase
MDQGTPAFFDIGNTLAAVRISPDGTGIDRLDVFPDVPPVLDELRARGARLGIISDRGPIPADAVDEALRAAGLDTWFTPELVIYGRKDSPEVFRRAAQAAGSPPRLLYVGEDPGERAQAITAGFTAVPHPRLAAALLDRPQPLRFVRITVPPAAAAGSGVDWSAAIRELPLLPVHVSGPAGGTLYAIGTAAAVAHLDDLGFRVDRLGAEDEPLTADLYLLRDDQQEVSGFLAPDGNSAAFADTGPTPLGVLASTDEGLLVAVPAGRSVESYHFRGARHGHNLKLGPLPAAPARPAERAAPLGLAEPETAAVTAAAPEAAAITAAAPEAAAITAAAPEAAAITAAERQVLDATVRSQALADHVARYSGAQPVDGGATTITSRHIQHPDNAVAVSALVADLQRIGNGRFTVRRHPFTHEGRGLENVEAEFPGRQLDGVVVVSAHMDSTGARQAGFRPAVDPAPGADDDASGVAGVLLAAEAIAALDAGQHPRRAVRFVLFNAEEHGLVGSLAYAREQAALGAPIVAALQLDMIGYDVRPEPTFELHAGFTPSPDVQARSLELVHMIAGLRPQVAPDLPDPQIYPAPGEGDLAERRSDHYSFQLVGYPACLASEDLFAGPGPDAPAEEMNPMYHLPSDTSVNAPYAADIARLVTAAAWVAATR